MVILCTIVYITCTLSSLRSLCYFTCTEMYNVSESQLCNLIVYYTKLLTIRTSKAVLRESLYNDFMSLKAVYYPPQDVKLPM